MSPTPPTAFVSYSWDSDEHRAWVRDIATRLRGDGVNVVLDRWHAAPGDQLPEFMERAIRDNRYVLVVCTPGYKERSDKRRGGVGYEGDIITGEVAVHRNHRKFIPILRSGEWAVAAPSWIAGKYFIDLRGSPYSEEQYADLVATLHGERVAPPPLGARRPAPSDGTAAPRPVVAPYEPLRITGVVADEVTTPRMDGTRGSGLYEIPFRLSRRPPSGWPDLFVRAWDRPRRFTNMHRPGIASVEGDKIWLRGTTLEEVERYHRDTLKLAVEQANEEFEAIDRERNARRNAEEERIRKQNESVRAAAKRLKFD